ncbi:MAG: NAD(P)H-hydrate dehydratase [Sterolibacterium sp.]|nr:NAD(P)H-hydrate dehydratase [Sterolibacterium sp.]
MTPSSHSNLPQRILRTPAVRALEQQHLNAAPPLMERAGRAAAELALQLLSAAPVDCPVLVVAGPGNNGGDAFVVARHLHQSGRNPLVIFMGHAEHLPADARQAYEHWCKLGGHVLSNEPAPLPPCALVIDGLFGIGLQRPIEGRYAELIECINALDTPVLALDIPSGLDAETGRICGKAVRATHTLSFIALKPGLLTLDGPDCCGQIHVHELNLPMPLPCAALLENEGSTITPELFKAALQPRARNSHKGSYGSAGILGGARGMAGAALLAGRAALHLGAGRVYLGMLAPLVVDFQQPELMLREANDIFELANALAIGPGLGQSPQAVALLQRAIASPCPVLFDADALNLLATHPVLCNHLAQRAAPTLLTPHPAEAARLLGVDIAHIQADRCAAAMAIARRCNAATLLKGCGSIIALPDGRWHINTTGNPGLATAGSGDVLSGFALALLAQGWPADLALLAATHLHGAAADQCVMSGNDPVGLCASELLKPARKLLNDWITAIQKMPGTDYRKHNPPDCF